MDSPINKTDLLIAYIEGRQQAAIEALLNNGCNPNRTASWGELPIMVAVLVGNIPAIKALIQHGVELNTFYADRTPLQYAISVEQYYVVYYLIRQADQTIYPDLRINPGEPTALMLAAEKNQVDLMRELISIGADVKLEDQFGCTYLDHIRDPQIRDQFSCK